MRDAGKSQCILTSLTHPPVGGVVLTEITLEDEYVPVKRRQKTAPVGAVFGALSTAP